MYNVNTRCIICDTLVSDLVTQKFKEVYNTEKVQIYL